ncbi:FlaG family protein [Campylobacter hepaticus]|uniref:FlaG family protein n=1 Tax=Campylobacter hepaticus TaxID=1813019 RepID=UPI0018C9DE2D|nr:FlaG family protein [Campylobacter hepaticus]MCZ0772021.1 FlaG family protein [Campylobacter hepaticus]MCZ0773490.1 FlaG family protein [Campylobacter hepaticus]MCZ0774740.1 FlaG family protein [Campylobacter hepaticus]QPM43414.1 flagellar protein FlaG [Campylobacter hepaticus]WAP49182.1 FlaG family protein [Campylobacter hepaticus]
MEVLKANNSMDPSFTKITQKTNPSQTDINKSQEGDGGQEQDMKERLADIVKRLNEQMESLDTNVRFGYSDKIGSMYISVTEKNTGKEIRKIPSEEAMRLAEYFRDFIGMIFDKES